MSKAYMRSLGRACGPRTLARPLVGAESGVSLHDGGTQIAPSEGRRPCLSDTAGGEVGVSRMGRGSLSWFAETLPASFSRSMGPVASESDLSRESKCLGTNCQSRRWLPDDQGSSEPRTARRHERADRGMSGRC